MTTRHNYEHKHGHEEADQLDHSAPPVDRLLLDGLPRSESAPRTDLPERRKQPAARFGHGVSTPQHLFSEDNRSPRPHIALRGKLSQQVVGARCRQPQRD